jgi:H+/Cl- antiporter ClcA
MTESSAAPAAGVSLGKSPGSPADLTSVLGSRGYHVLLLAAALIGLPIAVIAFGFLAAVTSMEKWCRRRCPRPSAGTSARPGRPSSCSGLAGVLVGLVVARLPGRGGHVSANGMGAGMTQPIDLTGAVLAATLSLVLGAVLGPEAPLIALGGGLAMLAANRTRLRQSTQGVALIAAAGSAAGIATIFGSPLVAAGLMLEVVGLAGSQLPIILLAAAVAMVTAVALEGRGRRAAPSPGENEPKA